MTTPPAAAATIPAEAAPRRDDDRGRASSHPVGPTRRRPLSLVLAAALGAGGLLPATTAASADDAPERRPAQDHREGAGQARRTAPGPAVQLAAPVALAAAAARRYVVQPGDTVSGIAARSGLSQRDVVAANGLDASGAIRAGQVLVLDRAAAAAATPGGTYVVRAGDTVSGIAARTGTSQRAVVEANGLDARASIREGQVLRLAGGAPAPTRSTPAPTRATTTYTVRRGDTVSGIAARTGTSQRAIVEANGLDARASIREGQVLRLTGGAPAPTRSTPAPTRATTTYTVRRGDTVSGIAARTGTSQRAIVEANGLDARASIREGQVLRLAGGAPAPTRSTPAPTRATTTYTVRRGDTVSGIAARTGTSQRAIVEANGLDARASIREGQVLRLTGGPVPAAAPTPAAPAQPGSYVVRPGDTLSTIARRQGTTVAALRQVNPGVGADGLIRVGQRLSVPGGSTSAAPAGAPVPSTFLGRTYPPSTTGSATANRDALRARPVPSREEMRALVVATARRWGVDPSLAQAVAFQESGFNMRAVSPANAVGVMQVIPSSGRWAADLAGEDIDLLDPQDNVTAGVVILRSLVRSAPDQATAIAGYYQGLGSVRSRGMYPDTRRYVASVQTLQRQYR
ncbi:LysM peptidoglycan-binding domain-containing protein [Pseudokineococcus basanitobsidens]|uniref:LysM peptidoglycan-binding domain-containing protein n=1 Tax=Pseudokineococcus basanitobsidens TaxID=1926649 RepID=A0ABU8RLH8_9ACTN